MKKESSEARRLEKLRRKIGEEGLDGVMMVPGPNLRYYTGVNSLLLERPFLFFVPRDGDPNMVSPVLEAGPYRDCPIEIRIHEWTDNEGPGESFEKLAREVQLGGSWGVEGRVPYLFLHHLMRYASPKFENGEPLLQGLRELKDQAELALIRKSASILSKSFLEIPHFIREGMTEQELGRKISDAVYSNGGERVEDLLVQSGPNSANPHWLPSSKKIRRGESIVVDVSSTYSGYYADITRTYMLGNDSDFEDLYGKVLQAEESAIRTSRSGATVGAVDEAARRSLRRQNLDKYFIHRTGHGLGLEVHEAPYIVAGGRERLLPSMVFTLEPGIYLPGKQGVRIEDNVVTTSRGSEVTTDLPKEYGWWR